MIDQNPFTFGSMITDPDRFIGRRAELTQIVDRLNGVQPQGSAVVGPRRIGKSSLLHYLYRPRDNEPLRPPPNMRVVYLDAQSGSCETPPLFRATLIGKVIDGHSLDRRTTEGRNLDVIRRRIADEQDCSWSTARAALELLPAPPVICLDEFEALLAEAFDDRFFNGLRNWANEGLLNWVTASARPLEELRDERGLSSPFFNLLATVQLGELTEPEAAELLALADRSSHPFSQRERRKLQKIAGSNSPYHLQIVAWYLWRMKAAGRVNFKLLRQELCRQPNPPQHCQRRPRPHPAWLFSGLLFVVVLLLMGVLWREAPSILRDVWQSIYGWGTRIFSGVSSFGDFLSGVIALALIGGAMWAVVRYHKPVEQAIKELWGRLGG